MRERRGPQLSSLRGRTRDRCMGSSCMLTRGAGGVQVHAVVWSRHQTIRTGAINHTLYTFRLKISRSGDDNRFGKILGGL
jgi:hypothetical protein